MISNSKVDQIVNEILEFIKKYDVNYYTLIAILSKTQEELKRHCYLKK